MKSHCSLQWCDSRDKTKIKRYGDVDSQNEVSIEGGDEYSSSKNVHKNSL